MQDPSQAHRPDPHDPTDQPAGARNMVAAETGIEQNEEHAA